MCSHSTIISIVLKISGAKQSPDQHGSLCCRAHLAGGCVHEYTGPKDKGNGVSNGDVYSTQAVQLQHVVEAGVISNQFL